MPNSSKPESEEQPQLLKSFPVGSEPDSMLRGSLKTLRGMATGKSRDLIEDILAGRRPARDLLDDQWSSTAQPKASTR